MMNSVHVLMPVLLNSFWHSLRMLIPVQSTASPLTYPLNIRVAVTNLLISSEVCCLSYVGCHAHRLSALEHSCELSLWDRASGVDSDHKACEFSKHIVRYRIVPHLTWVKILGCRSIIISLVMVSYASISLTVVGRGNCNGKRRFILPHVLILFDTVFFNLPTER